MLVVTVAAAESMVVLVLVIFAIVLYSADIFVDIASLFVRGGRTEPLPLMMVPSLPMSAG